MGRAITPTDPRTRVAVEVRNGRHVVRTSGGLLRAQRLHGPDDRARVALVGQTALLLGGDRVELEVEVGPGATLELSDIAGTVAYHGRGRPAAWHTTIRLGLGARLAYAGEPLILSDGADVTRTLTVDLAEGAAARLRETLVFGRAGEVGGRLDASTLLRRDGEEFHRERLVLDPDLRRRPGILADVRVLDSVLELGAEARAKGPDHEARTGAGRATLNPEDSRTARSARTDVVTYTLLDPGSTLIRFLGAGLAESPVT